MAELDLDSASLTLLDAANEIDMFLSLEVPVCGRTDVLSGKRLDNTLALLDQVGLPGMAATLRGAPEAVAGPALVEFQSGVRLSFRVDEGRAAQ